MIPLIDLIHVDPIFGAVVAGGEPPPPPPPASDILRNMVPFDADTMYTDRVRIVRVRRFMVGGSEQKIYDGEPGEPEAANVRPRSVTRDDAKAQRVAVQTIWDVRMPVNRQINPDDMFLFDDKGDVRRLVAEGRSVPKGEGGISYLTECTERK